MLPTMKTFATALTLATFFVSTLGTPVAPDAIDLEDPGAVAAIKTSDPNRCCTVGCRFCSTLTCQVDGCHDSVYTTCCNVELRQPFDPTQWRA